MYTREQQKPFTHLLSENRQENLRKFARKPRLPHQQPLLSPPTSSISTTPTKKTHPSPTRTSPLSLLPKKGLETPPTYGTFEDRPCFAHPNAKISLNGSSSMSNFSSPTSAESDTLTMYPKHRINNNHTPNN